VNESGYPSKIFLEIVEKIKQLIDENHLGPGDKIPSERELSDRLKVGRSSVREALRSLELLGLIETKRGEGTYICDFRNHRLVEIFGAFVLQSHQARTDLENTIQLIETGAIADLIRRGKKLPAERWEAEEAIDQRLFFDWLIKNTDNRLLLKIWRILTEYAPYYDRPERRTDKAVFLQLLSCVNDGDEAAAVSVYKNKINKCHTAVGK